MSRDGLLRFFAFLGSVAIYLVPLFAGVFLVFFFFNRIFLQPLEPDSEKNIYFEMKQDWDAETIAKELEKQGIIRSWYSVYYISKLKDDNKGKTIVAGEYELSPGQTPEEILASLFAGKTVVHTIEIPPGITVEEAIAIVADSGLVTEQAARESFHDQKLMRALGIPAFKPEGFLYTGTYEFSKPVTAEHIVGTIIEKGKQKLDEELSGWKVRASELGFRPYDVLTLASIIEEETSNSDERPKIAAVYHNRLRIGMPLQSNAALIYGIPNFSGRITQQDIKAEGLYNTYLNTGLPPTPISTPSADALRATLYPADTDHLYFLPKGNGEFLYSATYKEHQLKREQLGSAAEEDGLPVQP